MKLARSETWKSTIGALELDTGNVSGIVTKSGLQAGYVRVATVALVPRRGNP